MLFQQRQANEKGSDTDNSSQEDRDKAVQAGLLTPEKYECMICHKEKSSHQAVLNFEKNLKLRLADYYLT